MERRSGPSSGPTTARPTGHNVGTGPTNYQTAPSLDGINIRRSGLADPPVLNPGSKSTMLGHWRVALKQAEEAARAGRLEEALALASRPDVADHRQAAQLRGRLAFDLIGRAGRRGQADDVAGAISDLQAAEQYGGAPDALAAARLSLADRVAEEIRADLDAGEVVRVVERIDQMARQRITGPALRRLREAAEAWRSALDDARRGEFGRALEQMDRADRLAAETARAVLAVARRDIEARQASAHPKVERLYIALAAGQWGAILAAAEAVLETLPDHPAARQARTRSWQQIGAIHPSASLPQRNSGRVAATAPLPLSPAEPIRFLDEPATLPPVEADSPCRSAPLPSLVAGTSAGNSGPGKRFLLWADGIGGYLVCLDDRVVLGRAGLESCADVPLLGDISRRHATLVRDGDGYILHADQTTFLNGRRVETAPLRDGDVIRLGPTLELEFRQPSPISSTARLRILSRHRLPVAVDGIILMSETCIVGSSPQAHVPAAGLISPVVLYRQGTALWCRAPGGFEIDGRPCLGRAPLTLQSSVLGEGFSFSLESLGHRMSPV